MVRYVDYLRTGIWLIYNDVDVAIVGEMAAGGGHMQEYAEDNKRR